MYEQNMANASNNKAAHRTAAIVSKSKLFCHLNLFFIEMKKINNVFL